jgi:hypothetical protein
MYLTCAITRGPIARNANVQHLPHKPVGRWPLDLRSASHVPVPKKAPGDPASRNEVF